MRSASGKTILGAREIVGGQAGRRRRTFLLAKQIGEKSGTGGRKVFHGRRGK